MCPSSVVLWESVRQTQDISSMHIGAQNVYFEGYGAYTGEVSGEMLQELGCDFVLVGHSERRRLFMESEVLVAQKVRKALGLGLGVVLCVGELLEDREKQRAEKVVAQQVQSALQEVDLELMSRFHVAYEPIWAIGTDRTACSEDVEKMHDCIRQQLAQRYSAALADQVPILYGGSVSSKNVMDLVNQSNIDGVLVGSASLDLEHFLKIVHCFDAN